MKLSNLHIKELFGIYEYNLEFFIKDNISIIDAPNGKGKTTVLKLIKACIEGDIAILDAIPFKSLLLNFDSGDSIKVEKKDIFKCILDIDIYSLRNQIVHSKEEYNIDNISYSINNCHYEIGIRDDMFMMMTRRYTSRLNKIGDDNELTKLSDFITEEGLKNDFFVADELFSNLRKFAKNLNIYFIKANRLYVDSNEKTVKRKHEYGQSNPISSVQLYKREIKEKIMSVGRRYADESEKLDRTFPKRVLDSILVKKPSSDDIYSVDQISSMLKDLQKRRIELSELGLITETDEMLIDLPKENNLSEQTRIFLSNYIEDNIAKLDIYKDLAIKLDMLQEIVNIQSGFSDKKMRFSAKEGVIFKSKNGRYISVDKLSSGEKNDFILFYKLIFKCSQHSLILVDEPEISLHVSWQQEFINELLDICKLKGMQGIVATHSPNIVNNHWNLLLDLEDENNEE